MVWWFSFNKYWYDLIKPASINITAYDSKPISCYEFKVIINRTTTKTTRQIIMFSAEEARQFISIEILGSDDQKLNLCGKLSTYSKIVYINYYEYFQNNKDHDGFNPDTSNMDFLRSFYKELNRNHWSLKPFRVLRPMSVFCNVMKMLPK